MIANEIALCAHRGAAECVFCTFRRHFDVNTAKQHEVDVEALQTKRTLMHLMRPNKNDKISAHLMWIKSLTWCARTREQSWCIPSNRQSGLSVRRSSCRFVHIFRESTRSTWLCRSFFYFSAVTLLVRRQKYLASNHSHFRIKSKRFTLRTFVEGSRRTVAEYTLIKW